MINIDDRLLKQVNADKLWLLCHIAKHMDERLSCFPSNKTLCTSTGWGLFKVKEVKKELVADGILRIEQRYKGHAQISNQYFFNTSYISVFVNLRGKGGDETPVANATPPGCTDTPPPVANATTEVLTSEVLTTNNTLSPAHEVENETTDVEAIFEEKKDGAGGGEIPAAGAGPTVRVEIFDNPKATTPVVLESALRVFYTQYPNEWKYGVLENGMGCKYPEEKRKEIIKDFCCWAIEHGRGSDTYAQLNARLQGWFRNEQFSTWKKKAEQNAPTHQSTTTRPRIIAGQD